MEIFDYCSGERAREREAIRKCKERKSGGTWNFLYIFISSGMGTIGAVMCR